MKAIYIRYISQKKQNKRMEELIMDARELGTEMIPVRTTTEAASHAISRGYIEEDQLLEIASEKRLEEELKD